MACINVWVQASGEQQCSQMRGEGGMSKVRAILKEEERVSGGGCSKGDIFL